MNEIYLAIRRFLHYRFSLHEDNAEESDTVESIRKNVEFRGANLWTLIFAIFIASIGLNVNSTAVIIGAMLISPLMGPIMGVGLGIGINDFELVKKAGRNLAIATVISVITSTLYFWITPLHDASSELLARTSPSIWDVFIAGFGGLAGIIAATRKEKSNTIPGVAIATALMPPLCTAGYGLASGNVYFFIGAIYLYFINSIFICVATYLIVRYLNFHKKEFEDKAYEKRVRRYILIIVLITAAPSVYLAYRIVDRSIFENNAKAFIDKELSYTNTQVITRNYKYSRKGNEIDLLLLGKELTIQQIDSLKKKLPAYKLNRAKLNIRQGLNAKNELDFSQIKASILEAVYQKDSTAKKTNKYQSIDMPIPDLNKELRSLYPSLSAYSISNIEVKHLDTSRKDTLTLALMDFKTKISTVERLRLERWLKTRLQSDSLKVLLTD
ncbi:TIGR00341 family protein [Pedobacter psychroterrae]|uniref:TIGR00341 family protein n=1 Tax=Pedobacter psychroterrae TaxID=2530453 RepID=A0A4R0NTY7_9SPHI|nr:TIGR00341 family protein [Pedobacter psychroterrae]TCD02494.1 TIGR00341 family protein [Pedobacter psychroterrae]